MSIAKIKPMVKAVAITPSDSTEYNPPLRSVYIGGAGNLAVVLAEDSSAVTFTGLTVGIWHPMEVKKVMSTSTTATAVVGGY